MGTLVTTAQGEIPQAGSLVEVRGQRWGQAHASLNQFAALRRRFPVAVIFVVPRREAVR